MPVFKVSRGKRTRSRYSDRMQSVGMHPGERRMPADQGMAGIYKKMHGIRSKRRKKKSLKGKRFGRLFGA